LVLKILLGGLFVWSVLLSGEEESLEAFSKRFSFCTKIEDGKYFMVHPNFKSLKTNNEVFEYANKILETLMGILKVYNINCDINVVNVTKSDKTGVKHVSHDILTMLTINDPTEPSISLKQTNKLLKCAEQYENVAEALRYFNDISDGNLCFNLYIIYEIIRADLKDESTLLNTLRISKNKRSKFTQTLNNLCGDKSRHIPDKNRQHLAMSLVEAKNIIRNGLKNWINSKCNNQY